MHKPSLIQQLLHLFSRQPSTDNHQHFASEVTERNVTQGLDWSALYRDRYSYDREKVLSEALLAWRLNPLARRIVEIQTQYITDGIDFHVVDGATGEHDILAEQFLQDFWNHPLNRIGEHLRAYPTDLIAEIQTAPNDVQQETFYMPKATPADPDPKPIPSYWHQTSDVRHQKSEVRRLKSQTVMLHYAVNRLSGMLWGEPDIAPLLPWLARYASWLEDRMRLNRFRQAYLYVVKGQYSSEAERVARQKQLLASPPQPGSILVTDQSEEWGVISPALDSTDANSDGLALKKFIAGGRGYPLHWLAEPESSTRTTAEAAGTPTFKGLESRQKMFLSMVKDILQVVLQRSNVPTFRRARIVVDAADISERDNAALALASTQIVASFGQLWSGGLIETDEYLRIVYRFAGEVLPSARPDAPCTQPVPYPRPPSGMSIDADSGDVTTREE